MLFNSYQFLLVFLPITLLIYFGLSNLVKKNFYINYLISSLIFIQDMSIYIYYYSYFQSLQITYLVNKSIA